MGSRRAWGAVLISLVGCNAVSGVGDLVSDLDAGGGAAEGGSSGAPPPPNATSGDDAGGDAAPGPDARDAHDDFVPFDGADAHTVAIVFVTSTTYAGSFGGPGAADNLCQMRAMSAGLSGSYVAWLSVGPIAATSLVTSNGPWFLPTGELAVQRSDVQGGMGIQHAIDVDEHGSPQGDEAWTGTRPDGTPTGMDCSSWSASVNAANGTVGNVIGNGPGWTERRSVACTALKHLYCFQN